MCAEWLIFFFCNTETLHLGTIPEFLSVSFFSFQKLDIYTFNFLLGKWGYHRQGSCQAGLGAAIAENNDQVYVGAVGSWYWQGKCSIHFCFLSNNTISLY